MTQDQSAAPERFPNDEFATPRARQETHPTIESYLATRSVDEMAALTWHDTYRRNVFGSYRGTVSEQTHAVLAEMANRSSKPRRLLWIKISDDRYDAETPFGPYTVFWDDKRADVSFDDRRVGEQEYDLESGQRAAQGHFDARVGACLDPNAA